MQDTDLHTPRVVASVNIGRLVCGLLGEVWCFGGGRSGGKGVGRGVTRVDVDGSLKGLM